MYSEVHGPRPPRGAAAERSAPGRGLRSVARLGAVGHVSLPGLGVEGPAAVRALPEVARLQVVGVLRGPRRLDVAERHAGLLGHGHAPRVADHSSKSVRLGAPVLLGRRGRFNVGGRRPPPARVAPRRRGQPVLLGHRALAHGRAVEDGPPVVVGLAADVLVDAESVRGELAAADGAGQQAARRRGGGGERGRIRGRLPPLRARRGPRRLRLELRPEGGGGGLARRVVLRGAGPGRACRPRPRDGQRQRARRVRRVAVPGPPVERRPPRSSTLLEVLLELAL